MPHKPYRLHTELGQAIRRLRAALGGISQEGLARQLGTTVRTIARWEASAKLSPGVLSRLRNVACAIPDEPLAEYFEKRLREDLNWRIQTLQQ